MGDPELWFENFQEQTDELDAMEAIYEEEFVLHHKVLSVEDVECSSIQLVLPIEIDSPDGMSIDVCVYTKEEGKEKIGSFQFHHVPAVTLSFELPKSYPIESGPNFTISSSWLSKEALSLVCGELDSICASDLGVPILFSLCDWIKYEMLTFLSSKLSCFELIAENKERESKYDRRAIPQCPSLQDTLSTLTKYDQSKKWEEFQQLSHECNLCLEKKNGMEFQQLSCCQKAFCIQCITEMCTLLVKNGTVHLLECPNCSVDFHPNFLSQYLSKGEMERWERLTLQRSLEAMEDIYYCPRCEAIVMSEENGENFGQCAACSYSFCTNCMDTYHNNTTCDEMAAQMKKVRQSKDYKNQLKSLKMIQAKARKCPHCSIYIQRTSGCNKMTCSQCSKYFCYSCGSAIAGYDHFATDPGASKGKCKIFDEVTDDMLYFYAHVQQQNLAENVGREEYAMRVSKYCPFCGQVNYKSARNNDIACRHCKNHFCFLCSEKIKGTTHFLKGCVQHSD